MTNSSEVNAAQKPTHTRYWLIVFAVTLAVIQYIDRICISKASSDMRDDLGISKIAFGNVFSAFGYAYALFEIPSGWMGDRFGPRKALIRVVLWWSFFTIATGWAGGLISLLAIRFLFGAGEAGCFPNLTRSMVNWLTPSERVRAQGILWLAARWGGAATPLLVGFVLTWFKGQGFKESWRESFYVFGALGIVWVVFFAWWFRDNPGDHPGVNAAEKKLLAPNAAFAKAHGKVPWKLFLSSKSAWLLWVQYFCLSYVWYFYTTWLSDYLKSHYAEVSDVHRNLYAGVPLFCGGIGCLISGFVTKQLAASLGSVRSARRWLASLGMLGTAGAMLFLALSDTKTLPVYQLAIALGAASMFGDFTMPCSWGACMDVGGRFAGTFSGSMNMMGNIGGALCPQILGFAAESDKWNMVFASMAVAALIGSVCWMLLDAETPIDRGSAKNDPDATAPAQVEEL